MGTMGAAVTCYRFSVAGAVKPAKPSAEYGLIQGTCFHACKTMEGVTGILREGKVKGMPYDVDDPD